MLVRSLVADVVTIHDTSGREIHRELVVDGRPVEWYPDYEVTVLSYVWHGGVRIGPNPPTYMTLRPGDVLRVPVELTMSDA